MKKQNNRNFGAFELIDSDNNIVGVLHIDILRKLPEEKVLISVGLDDYSFNEEVKDLTFDDFFEYLNTQVVSKYVFEFSRNYWESIFGGRARKWDV